jgi:hypothetical protein
MPIEKSSNTYAAGHAGFGNESMDCVVRALSIAANKPYADVHKVCADAGRVFGKKTAWSVTGVAAKHFNLEFVSIANGNTNHDWSDGWKGQMTLMQFVKAYPEGRFLVLGKRHAVALVDGVVHDWNNSRTKERSRIYRAWKVL